MKNILVKEYVRGNIRDNVFNVEKVSERRGKTKLYLQGKYRFSSYELPELESKLIRSLYGNVYLIVYVYTYTKSKIIELDQPSLYETHKVLKRPNVILYSDDYYTIITHLQIKTFIFTKPS